MALSPYRPIALSPISRMFCEDFLAEELDVEVGVYLGGDDALMTEHLLDGAEAGTTFQEMGSKGVTEGMRGDSLRDACCLCQLLDDSEDHHTGELGAAAVQKEIVFVMRFDDHLAAALQPETYLLNRDGRQRHKTLFASLAIDTHVAKVEIDIRQFQVDQFGDTETRAIEGLYDGEVAVSERL